ncbi:MAG TPA: response regulator [Kofleriaceae bacterium]|nr:response regulator [Kofleriaceae bacterium]
MEARKVRAETQEPVGRARASARDRLRLGCLGAIAATVVYLAAIWLTFPRAAPVITLGSSLFMAVAGLIYVAVTRWGMPDPWIPRAGAALLLSMSAALLYAFAQVGAPGFTVFMVLQVLAAGAMHSNTRWMIVSMVVGVGAWLVLGFSLFGSDYTMVASTLILAAVIALLVHLVLMRYLASLEQMRERDSRHHDELSAALAATQRELTERQRAEAERERLREQLLHSQKLEAIGTLAGGVAHDMNNTLAAVIGLAELMRDDTDGEIRAGLDQIIEASRRATELTRNLLGFSRRGKYRKERFELSSVVASVVPLLSRTLPKGIELSSADTAALSVEGDSAQLGQVLVNLCLNASDAMSGQGRLAIEVAEAAIGRERAGALGLAAGRYVTLTVSDTGCGMDRETLSRIFEPFFTTREQGRGLGLAMVYGTVTNHGGAIDVDSEPGRGTAIAIYLPAVQAERSTLPPPMASAAPVPAGLVLLVDDEPMVRTVTRRVLERVGYQVITASDGAEGVERYAERRAEICLVLLDMAMPVMGGAECFRRLRAIDPEARVLLASGYALEQEARDCLAAGALGFLEKPFTSARLLDAVARARRELRMDAPAPLTLGAAQTSAK